MKNQKNKKLLNIAVVLFSIFYFLFSILMVSAASEINLKYPWSGETTPAGLVNKFYLIALGLAAACALGVLIFGAILWTLSGAVTSKQDALEWIKGALWGLVLLLAAYLILHTINPDLVNLSNPTPITTESFPASSGH
jgi:hypothetical protein